MPGRRLISRRSRALAAARVVAAAALSIAALSCSETSAPPVATQLVLTTPAAGAASGLAFMTQPAVTFADAAGDIVSTSGDVTMTVSTGATVVGSAVASATGGVAT